MSLRRYLLILAALVACPLAAAAAVITTSLLVTVISVGLVVSSGLLGASTCWKLLSRP